MGVLRETRGMYVLDVHVCGEVIWKVGDEIVGVVFLREERVPERNAVGIVRGG